MDSLLFVWHAAAFQSMELERAEAMRGFQSGTSSRLWPAGADRLYTPECEPLKYNRNPACCTIHRAASAQDRSVQLSRLELLLQSGLRLQG